MERNRGTGAGGAETNRSGLSFENKIDCSYLLDRLGDGWCFKNKGKFIPFMKMYEAQKYRDNKKMRFNGTKQPDEAIINIVERKIVIIEKKNQNGGGSVIEKLQTAEKKKTHYKKRYPEFSVEYGYLLAPRCFIEAPGEIDDLQNETDIFVICIDEGGEWRNELMGVFI